MSSESSSSLSRRGEAPEDNFTDEQLAVLIDIAFVLSALSALGSLFIVVSYFKFQRLHTFAFKLILWLAFANIGLDAAYLMGDAGGHGDTEFKCYVQGIMRVWFALVGFALTTAIVGSCYLMIVRRSFAIQDRLPLVLACSVGVPLGMSLLPLITDSYGDAGAWCSITSTDLTTATWGTVWRFAIIYVPLWLAVLVNFWMYFRVSQALRSLETAAASAYREEGGGRGGGGAGAGGGGGGGRGGGMSVSLQIVNRLRLYPMVLLVCWSWATVNRIYEAVNPYDTVFWLYVLQYTFQTMQGVLNAIIFAMTPTVVEEWTDQLQKWRLCGPRETSAATAIDQTTLLPAREGAAVAAAAKGRGSL